MRSTLRFLEIEEQGHDDGINRLLSASFGIFVYGDWEVPGCDPFTPPQRCNRLGQIRRLSLLSCLFLVPEAGALLGIFTQQDGSTIVVPDKNIGKAERYRELYRIRYGQDVTIQTVRNTNHLY